MQGECNKKVLTSWNELIYDARQKISAAKERVLVLRKALKNLEKVRDSGQPWPHRSQSTDQKSEAATQC
jgi:hypothetical protein